MNAPRQPTFPYATRQHELQRLIVRALKTRLERGRFSTEDGVDVAFNQVFRPRGPRIPEHKKDDLRIAIQRVAKMLEPPTAQALYGFAKQVAELAWLLHPRPRSPLAPQEDAWFGSGELARAAIAAELSAGGGAFGADDLVRRAVRRGLSARRKSRPGPMLPTKSGDPLRDLLDVPLHGVVRLPGKDFRWQMASTFQHEGALSDAMRTASIFHSERMEKALGPLLWALCRPVGFSDKKQTRILIASSSSTAAQETIMHSREILFRLQQMKGLEKITGVKVTVDVEAFHLWTRR
ncbi:MAG: hypothetical protein Q8O67_33310 [Deltaproteobacteria bacterium]|nr:hypothetical protein [Deltaproteobacteria bacterium]